MKRKLFAVLLSFLTASSHALTVPNKETFMSLTRRATPIKKLPTNIEVITAEEIEKMGAHSLDEVIGSLTSVQTGRSGSEGTFTSFRLRGVPSSAQSQIVIDDQPYGGFSVDQLVDISRIPIDNIERIEVVRGGSSVLYGANTTGGVIHIITKRQISDKPHARVGHELRGFNTHVLREEVGARQGLLDGFATYNHFKTDGFQTNSDVDAENGSANFGLSLEAGGRISLQFSRNEQDTGVPQGTAVPIQEWNGRLERPAANPTKRVRADRSEGNLKLESPLATVGSIQSTFYGSDAQYRSFNSIDIFDPDFAKDTHVFGNDTRFMGDCGLTTGLSYERNYQRSSFYSEAHVVNWGAYVQHQVSMGPLDLLPALRFDQNSRFGNEYNPRFSAVLHQSDSTSWSTNIARSYRAPDFFHLFFNSPTQLPNPGLNPESAWTYDLGFRTETDHVVFKTTGYYTRIKDRIFFINNPGLIPDTYVNVSQAEINGAEVELEHRLGRVSQAINYNFRRSRGNSPTSSDFVPFAMVPRHTLNYKLDVDLPSAIQVNNTVQYVTRQYSNNNLSGILLPTYTVWNARVSKGIGRANIFFGVNNILNRRYAESFDFHPTLFADTLNPMPRRNFRAGIDLKFGGEDL